MAKVAVACPTSLTYDPKWHGGLGPNRRWFTPRPVHWQRLGGVLVYPNCSQPGIQQ